MDLLQPNVDQTDSVRWLSPFLQQRISPTTRCLCRECNHTSWRSSLLASEQQQYLQCVHSAIAARTKHISSHQKQTCAPDATREMIASVSAVPRPPDHTENHTEHALTTTTALDSRAPLRSRVALVPRTHLRTPCPGACCSASHEARRRRLAAVRLFLSVCRLCRLW